MNLIIFYYSLKGGVDSYFEKEISVLLTGRNTSLILKMCFSDTIMKKGVVLHSKVYWPH